jgi:hypothetical protein
MTNKIPEDRPAGEPDYSTQQLWFDLENYVVAMRRRLLERNDDFGNRHMRKAILDEMGEFARFAAGRFARAGVIDAEELAGPDYQQDHG